MACCLLGYACWGIYPPTISHCISRDTTSGYSWRQIVPCLELHLWVLIAFLTDSWAPKGAVLPIGAYELFLVKRYNQTVFK